MQIIKTTDELRLAGIMPSYFGLGFIQCKVNDVSRYHFWHPSLAPTVPEEQIHDHRYHFVSTIIRGKLTHETYSYIPDPNGNWEKIVVSCDPNNKVDYNDPFNATIRCRIKLTGIYDLKRESTYTFMSEEFHKTKADRAVTYLTRVKPPYNKYAQVIKPINEGIVCPFEKKIPESELWEMIDDLLKGE